MGTFNKLNDVQQSGNVKKKKKKKKKKRKKEKKKKNKNEKKKNITRGISSKGANY